MDLYILDEKLRRASVVDQYESLIWTERFADAGELQLEIRSDRNTRKLFIPGQMVAINESHRVQVIDTVEKTTNDDGTGVLKISGVSLEKWMDGRVAKDDMQGSTANPTWEISGTPKVIAETVFNTSCVTTPLDDSNEDALPFYTAGSQFPAGNIPPFATSINVALPPDSVFNVIKNICNQYAMGFRITRKDAWPGVSSTNESGLLYFAVYTGSDRTTGQLVYPAVVFSEDLENLSGVSQLSSSAALKNVAIVVAPAKTLRVYANGGAPGTKGFERKALYVDASDITYSAIDPALDPALTARGLQALAQNRSIIAFDGEIPQYNSYIYGKDYNLGDLVETRSDDNLSTKMLVTEQIFISDRKGVRSYPTLAIDTLITAGSWESRAPDEYWSTAAGYWSEQP